MSELPAASADQVVAGQQTAPDPLAPLDAQDRAIAEKMQICGSHFPFPGAGTFVKDGNAYAFTSVTQS